MNSVSEIFSQVNDLDRLQCKDARRRSDKVDDKVDDKVGDKVGDEVLFGGDRLSASSPGDQDTFLFLSGALESGKPHFDVRQKVFLKGVIGIVSTEDVFCVVAALVVERFFEALEVDGGTEPGKFGG